MDLSTAASAGASTACSSNSSSSNSNSNSSTTSSSGAGSAAVACPVCTLYLREGISLQKHLDTHPKEQVIEALIRASASGGGVSAFLSNAQQQPPAPQQQPQQQQQQQQQQHQQQHQHIPATPQPTPSPGLPASSPSPHVPPHAQSPYPVGPIYECPPINTMMPPQFASFSYQQFVNNGTMMIPAQYAMAQAQAPQTSQMMQMLYSPYGMYHQQQIPTVQMISAPPMMPTSSAALPTSVAAGTTRMRPTSSTATVTSINEITTPTTSAQSSPARPQVPCSQAESAQVVEAPKQQQHRVMSPGPDRILPDLEMPASPESTSAEANEEHNASAEHSEQQAHSEQQQQVEQYKRSDPPTLISNSSDDNADDDKTERILPDIEDNQEIESLLVRGSCRIQSRSDTENHAVEPMEVVESVVTSVQEDADTVVDETIENEKLDSCRKAEENFVDNVLPAATEENAEPRDEPVEETQAPSIDKPEIDHISRLLVNMDREFSNVELSHDEESNEKIQDDLHDVLSVGPMEKSIEEDESTNISYQKTTPEPIECKIIVSHDDSDVSSVVSSDSLQCDVEIQKLIPPSSYSYKRSQSAPTSPVPKEKFATIHRSLSRCSLRSDLDRSNENLCPYPVGFEATTLQDYLKDNYNDEDMELEEPHHHAFIKENAMQSSDSISMLKARRSKVPSSPLSPRSTSSYCRMEDDEDDSDVDSCDSKDDEDDDDEEEQMLMEALNRKKLEAKEREAKEMIHKEDCKAMIGIEIKQQKQEQPADFRSQSLIAENYSHAQFPLDLHTVNQQQKQQQSQANATSHHDTYPITSTSTSQNLLNMSEGADPTTSVDSKSYTNSSKSVIQKPTAELLNINEDAHAGPMNVFEFDGLQILVPSTFISESSQKAVSGTSQQSMSSCENGAGIDEEVKSVNMRADETMPPRGELSEQESNGCTEQSAWQLYMGQESSRMSTSYDLMARESWTESEGSDHEDNNGGPLLDSRSLATHFTSSLFLDRDRKTPTRRVFKCTHCDEVFECPKERRVHSAMVHKEAGPSGCSNDNMDMQSELKDIKLLESRANMFEDIFVPNAIHAQQVYHQQPLLHQLQPPQHASSVKADGDVKLDGLHLSAVTEVTCNLCNQRFTSEKSLQLHHRRVHIAEPAKRIRETAKCQICNEEFASVASFNLHLKIHPLECGQCGKYFYRKQNFKLHMKRHLGIKPFPCTLCDKAFLTKQKLDEHTNGHTGNAPVKCNMCNETFRRYSNLTQHKNRHHLNIKKKQKDYICHCGEVFHTKKKLAWHKETHDDKPKSCTYCNERFIHMASLTRHMRRAHNRRFVPDAQRENENVECTICKCIYLRSSLAVHMRVHNGEKPYECQVCSKAFSTKWNLQLHKWTHAARSTKPFKCGQCSAAFYRHSDYTAHMNSHRNVRPYTCNYCGAQFIRKYNCLRHVKEHEENKQYTCEVCNKTFHRSYYLKEHQRVHTGQRPYTCHICGKSSSTKSNHNKHVRIHHAREPVNTEN